MVQEPSTECAIVNGKLVRTRVFHTNGVTFGLLGVSFFALLNYAIPKWLVACWIAAIIGVVGYIVINL